MIDGWIYGLIGLFFTVVIFYVFTPAMVSIQAATGLFNFADVATNTSFTTTRTYVETMWNAWPIVAGALVFIVLFIWASERGEMERSR